VAYLPINQKRYVGAQIGIYNPDGEKVGKVSHLSNKEYLFLAGPDADQIMEHVGSERSAIAERRDSQLSLGGLA